MNSAREETTKSKVLWLHINNNNANNYFNKKSRKQNIRNQGRERWGRNKRDEQKSWLPVYPAKKRLISRGGRISGLM